MKKKSDCFRETPWKPIKMIRIMKLTIMLMLVGILQLSANVSAQNGKMNVHVTDMQLSDFLWQLQEESDIVFIYQTDDLKDVGNIALERKEASITDILDAILVDTNLEYILDKNVVVIKVKEVQQAKNTKVEQQDKKKVKGTVTDEDGTSLPGASVLIKGTYTGTLTDSDGNYEIEADNGNILVFSYIGFETVEILVNKQTIINIQLVENINDLSEVIITGIAKGTDKRKIPFAVDKVNQEDIEKVPGLNIASTLQGKISGATIVQGNGSPGEAPSIRLRGSTNIVGSQSPLIIIDGVITAGDGSLQDFNSDDIESIEVVKGAAAASLYGSRSANGVINITTKRGGNIDGRTAVTFRNEVGLSMIPDFIPLSKHHPYMLDANGAVDPTSLDINQFADNDYPTLFNHQDRLFENALFYTNFVSFGSSSEKTNLYWSVNNTKQNGTIVDTDGFSRQNIRLNIDHKLSDKLLFKTSSSYSLSKKDGRLSGIGSVFMNSLSIPPNLNLDEPNEEDGSPYNYDIANVFIPGSSNPLYELNNIDNQSKRNRFTGAYSLNYKLITPLTLEVAYTIDKTENNQETFLPKDYLDLGRNPNKGRFAQSSFDSKYQTASFKATYSENFNDFDFTSQFYYLYEDVKNNFSTTAVSDFRFTDVRSLSNTKSPSLTTSDSSLEEIVTENFYFITNLVYKDKLILDAMVRRDGSSLFGANNRWNTFYRGSMAYRLSEDVKIEGVNEFKLRASYGTAGNRPGYSYRFETLTTQGTKSTIGNKDLRSSLSKEIEFGIDARFLDDYSFSVTYANSKSTEQFWLLDQPMASGGFPSKWVNLDASLDAKAYEASLSGPIYSKNDFEITGSLIFGKIDQKLTKFNHASTFSNGLYLEEGIDFGVLRAEKFATSIDQLSNLQQESGNYAINSDGYLVNTSEIGTLKEAPVKILDENGAPKLFNVANYNPDFNLGLSLNVKYKGFSLFVLSDWKQGGDIYNSGKQLLYLLGRDADVDQANVPQDFKKPIGYYAAIANNNTAIDYFVEDGTFVKIREVRLGYEFSKKQLGALGNTIKGIQLSVIGRNLFTFTKYSGYDPEVSSGSVQNAAFTQSSPDLTNRAIDSYSYPNSATITGILEIKF